MFARDLDSNKMRHYISAFSRSLLAAKLCRKLPSPYQDSAVIIRELSTMRVDKCAHWEKRASLHHLWTRQLLGYDRYISAKQSQLINSRLLTTDEQQQQQQQHQSEAQSQSEAVDRRGTSDADGSVRLVHFDDGVRAFRPKSTSELLRALFILRLCSSDWFVDKALTLVDMSTRILGQTLTDWLLRATAYGHFVAGNCPSDLDKCISKLSVAGVRPMLAVPMEEDVGETIDSAKYDRCRDTILDVIRMEAGVEDTWPMIQLKMTSLVPAEICVSNVSKAVSFSEMDKKAISGHVPEPHKDDATLDHLADVMAGRRKQVELDYLDVAERDFLTDGLQRLTQAIQLASSLKMVIWVDAEYTYINPALRLLSLAAMKVYNQRMPVVSYTYQNYLQATLQELREDIEFSRKHNVCFGAKLVRGAYMEKERLLSQKLGYPDPVHPDIEKTHAMYDTAVSTMLDAIHERPSMINVIIGTHNEQSVHNAIQRMKELGMQTNSGQVFFGQVFGMADHISCSLGQAGYLIFKSLPYGSISDTLPYLGRRAQENRAIFQGARKERQLLWGALKARMFTRR